MEIKSEGPIRLTKAVIDAAWRRRSPGHRLIVRDQECRGLALFVNPTGMAWSYSYRPRGIDPKTGKRWPNQTITIGNPATHSPDDARIATNKLKGQTAAGADPVAEKKARTRVQQKKRGSTVRRLIDDYAKALPARPKMRGSGLPSSSYVSDELAQLRAAALSMNAETTPAADLTPSDMRKITEGVGAATARARFGALSRFLDWCLDEEHIQANPCLLVARARRPRAPPARSHYLTPADLARLWHAAEELTEPVWRDVARFMIAIPGRRKETRFMEWPQIDLDAAEWRIPSLITKNEDPHRLRLHPLALDVLLERRKSMDGNGLVFPAPKSGKAIDTFSSIKSKIAEASGLHGWRLHDFRRSFTTALGEEGIHEAVVDAMLNHRQAATRGGVLGVYQRASRWPEQKQAMEHWGRVLASAVSGGDEFAVVVPLIGRG